MKSPVLSGVALVLSFPSALARVFHSSGARVILAGRNVQKLQQLKFQLDSESSSVGVATPPGSPRTVSACNGCCAKLAHRFTVCVAGSWVQVYCCCY